MNRYTATGVLFRAALLEAGGDAIIRVGLRTQVLCLRLYCSLRGLDFGGEVIIALADKYMTSKTLLPASAGC